MVIPARPPIAPDVAKVIGDCAENVENRSLLLDKFVLHKSWPLVFLDSTHQPMRMDDASRWSFIRMAQNGDDFLQREIGNCDRAASGKNASEENREKARIKGEILRDLKKCACRKLPGSLEAQKLQQNRQFAQALSKRPGLNAVVYGELQGRLIVNLSDSLIQNAGICLDRNTGLPFIPGSAVKGVARHAALAHLRNKEWTIDEFMRVFGSSEVDFREKGELHNFAAEVAEDKRTLKGGVDFLSAQPITEPTIMVDISNVHYPDYYQSGNLRDLANESPKPNTFPVVEKGVRYAFCITENGMENVGGELFEKAKSVLIEAITVSGIGAKTGAGYGWFKDVTEVVEADAMREAKAAEEKLLAKEKKAAEAAAQAEAKAKAEILAALSPCERVLERWKAAPNIKAIVNSSDIAKFGTHSEEDKKGIVEALRTADSIGAKVWAVIKGVSADDPKKKLRNGKAESDIRGYCKNTLKLGSMP